MKQKKLQSILSILSSKTKIKNIIKKELEEIRDNYAVERRTQIIENYEEKNLDDLIEKEDVVLTLTKSGYVKIVPVDTYRSQKEVEKVELE